MKRHSGRRLIFWYLVRIFCKNAREAASGSFFQMHGNQNQCFYIPTFHTIFRMEYNSIIPIILFFLFRFPPNSNSTGSSTAFEITEISELYFDVNFSVSFSGVFIDLSFFPEIIQVNITMIPNMTITPINHPGITCHDDFTPAVPAAPINIPHTINIGYLTFLIFSFILLRPPFFYLIFTLASLSLRETSFSCL